MKTGITCEIIHDGCRFIALNIEVMRVAAGHVLSALAFTPQGTRLYQIYGEQYGRHLEVVSGSEQKWNPTISVLVGHEESVDFVEFSGDGKRLVSASEDRTVRLWDGQTGAEIAVLQGHSEWVFSVVFSPDGTRLASASGDKTVRLWDGQTGAEIAVLQGHSERVNSVVFSPDSTRLASESDNKTVQLWKGQTGAEIASFLGSLLNFTLDSSKFLLMNNEEVYYINCITGDKSTVSLGMFIDLVVTMSVSGLDLWIIHVRREQPSLKGLLVVKILNNSDLCIMSLCQFPPSLSVSCFSVFAPSQVAIGCNDGQVLLLETDFSSLL